MAYKCYDTRYRPGRSDAHRDRLVGHAWEILNNRFEEWVRPHDLMASTPFHIFVPSASVSQENPPGTTVEHSEDAKLVIAAWNLAFWHSLSGA